MYVTCSASSHGCPASKSPAAEVERESISIDDFISTAIPPILVLATVS